MFDEAETTKYREHSLDYLKQNGDRWKATLPRERIPFLETHRQADETWEWSKIHIEAPRRWKIEETFRFRKQSDPLEDIRVLRYQRLKNLVVLVTAAAYFAALLLG